MKTTRVSSVLVMAVAACGGGGGGGGGASNDAPPTADSPAGGGDAPITADAPVGGGDAPVTHDGGEDHDGGGSGVPANITITGTAFDDSNGTPTELSGVLVEFDKASDDSILGSATSGTNGSFSMTIATGGDPVSGYFHGTKSSYTDNYEYPPTPLSADYSDGEVDMISTTVFGFLKVETQQSASDGFVIAVAETANGSDVGSASGSSSAGGTVEYDKAGDQGPQSGTTSTDSDGTIYFINVPAGATTISVKKTGLTFGAVSLKARANVLTTTNVAAQ